jgi:hypothetical protein
LLRKASKDLVSIGIAWELKSLKEKAINLNFSETSIWQTVSRVKKGDLHCQLFHFAHQKVAAEKARHAF